MRLASAGSALARALAPVVGSDAVRPGSAADAVCAVVPAAVAEPRSVEQTAALLRLVGSERLATVVRGTGTKLGWGAPPERLDLVVSTRRLARLLEHAAGDFVVRAQAGMRLAALQAAVGGAGQFLAIDPPGMRGTLGGVVATATAGPRRLRYGGPRDLLLGLTVVLADGTVAHAGGKVVKNVAGYDLGKLFCGSFGTLGLIVETTFRLHPLPAVSRTVTADTAEPGAVARAVQATLHQSAVVPSGVELAWPPGRLLVRIEGSPGAVESQAEQARLLLAPFGPVAELTDEVEADAWRRLEPADPPAPGTVRCQLSTTPSELAATVAGALECGAAAGATVRLTGRAATVCLDLELAGGDPERYPGAIGALRRRLVAGGGSLVVTGAPPELGARFDIWGPGGATEDLLWRVKLRFDPERLLAPGRFVGGI